LTPDFVRSDDGAALGCAETFASGGAKFIAASSKTVNEVRPVTFKADLFSRVCVEVDNDLKGTIPRSRGVDVCGDGTARREYVFDPKSTLDRNNFEFEYTNCSRAYRKIMIPRFPRFSGKKVLTNHVCINPPTKEDIVTAESLMQDDEPKLVRCRMWCASEQPVSS